VMILLEMVHDARIVRLNSEHPPADVKMWLGDSIGWWDRGNWSRSIDDTTIEAGTPGRGGPGGPPAAAIDTTF